MALLSWPDLTRDYRLDRWRTQTVQGERWQQGVCPTPECGEEVSHYMLDLPYSLVIEATADPNSLGFYSPD